MFEVLIDVTLKMNLAQLRLIQRSLEVTASNGLAGSGELSRQITAAIEKGNR